MNKLKNILIILLFVLVQGEAFVIDPSDNAMSHNSSGLSYLKDNNIIGAIEEFKLAIALSPNSATSATFYNNLGITYLRIRRTDWAIACFNKAINLNPNFLEYYKNLITAYKYKKALNKEAGKLRNTINRNKLDSRSWLLLGLIYRELHSKNQAVKCLEEFIKLEPDLILSESVKNIINTLK